MKKLRLAIFSPEKDTEKGTEKEKRKLEAQIQYLTDLLHENESLRADGEDEGGYDFIGVVSEVPMKDLQPDVDLLLAYSIKSFSSNTVEAYQKIQSLKSQGVDCYIPLDHIDTRTDYADILLSTLLFFAKKETSNTSKRVKKGIHKMYGMGQDRWARIFGYTRNAEQTYVIVPLEAEVIRRIFSEYEHGKSIQGICDGLNADGIKTAENGIWKVTTIRSVLKNEKYAGQVRLLKRGDGEEILLKNHHEAIVSLKTYERVQKLLAMKSLGGKGEGGKSRSSTTQYPFGDIPVLCPLCGKPMIQKDVRVQNSGRAWVCHPHFVIRSGFVEEGMVRAARKAGYEYEKADYYWIDELVDHVDFGQHEDYLHENLAPTQMREAKGEKSDFTMTVHWKDAKSGCTTVGTGIGRLKDVPSVVARLYQEKLVKQMKPTAALP